MNKMVKIKAIIFDWGRTLFNSETKEEYPEAKKVLQECKNRGYRLALASLVSIHSNADLPERQKQIQTSPLRIFFDIASVTEVDKDKILDEIVKNLNYDRKDIMIVDDRTVRGIRYGNTHGHPTVWLRKGKFSNELPNNETGEPTFTINSLLELLDII